MPVGCIVIASWHAFAIRSRSMRDLTPISSQASNLFLSTNLNVSLKPTSVERARLRHRTTVPARVEDGRLLCWRRRMTDESYWEAPSGVPLFLSVAAGQKSCCPATSAVNQSQPDWLNAELFVVKVLFWERFRRKIQQNLKARWRRWNS